MPERSKRHHYVPQLHLRAFATGNDKITTIDRRESRSWDESVGKAAAENDYNTITGEDGDPSDEVERRISLLEDDWARALVSARDGDLLGNAETKVHLAYFIAFQYLRVPHQRHLSSRLADVMVKLEIAAGGPSRIRADMEAAGLRPTDAQVLAEWERETDFDAFEVSQTTEGHLSSQFAMLDEIAGMLLAGYQWTVWRWEGHHLLSSDHPVILEPAHDHPSWSGVGFSTAGAIHLAIARDTALVLVSRSDLDEAGYTGLPDIALVTESLDHARSLNWMTAAQSRRFVYHHPDDSIDQLVGTARELPPPRDDLIAPDVGVELRDKLVAMGRWAYLNPDKPHPMAGVGRTHTPPPGARTPVVDGRTRRIRYMQDHVGDS